MNRADNMSNNNSSIATRTFKIATYDIGFNNQMKISSIMKYQQDLAIRKQRIILEFFMKKDMELKKILTKLENITNNQQIKAI